MEDNKIDDNKQKNVIILSEKEQKEYDSLPNKTQKEKYIKAIKLSRQASSLQKELNKKKRKADDHEKYNLGGCLVNAFDGELYFSEERRQALIAFLNREDINSEMRKIMGLPQRTK